MTDETPNTDPVVQPYPPSVDAALLDEVKALKAEVEALKAEKTEKQDECPEGQVMNEAGECVPAPEEEKADPAPPAVTQTMTSEMKEAVDAQVKAILEEKMGKAVTPEKPTGNQTPPPSNQRIVSDGEFIEKTQLPPPVKVDPGHMVPYDHMYTPQRKYDSLDDELRKTDISQVPTKKLIALDLISRAKDNKFNEGAY